MHTKKYKGVYRRKRLVFGIGINDSNYVTQVRTETGNLKVCPFFRTWKKMLERCYDKNLHMRQPTYVDCKVCDDWLTFSNFKKWMEQQDWQEKQLDKDLLVKGNKLYSPETCVFVPSIINSFITASDASRGDFAIGVHFHKSSQKFVAKCRNPFTGNQEHLGYFSSEQDAHRAWRNRKHEIACKLALMVNDQRLIDVLRKRYA